MARVSKPAASGRRTVWRFLRARPRLYAAIVAALGAAALVPQPFGTIGRAVVGWDVGALLYLALVMQMAAGATPASMHGRAAAEDATRWAFLALMAGAAFVSMFALFGILHAAHGADGHVPVQLTLAAGGTILISWLFAHTAFAVHYAHGYYSDRAAAKPAGLSFPGDDRDPDYWDFLYFSFVVGMTCQVSDVQVTTRFWRRLVLAHGVLAFLFNTVVLALCINLIAGQL